MASDLTRLIRLARSSGWVVEQTRRRGHYVFRDPSGRKVATAASSASDVRSLANTISHLRKGGLPVPHRGGRTRERNR